MSIKKPNIVEIVADDLGCWAVHYAGNHEVHTPNIDRLASEGIYFVNFFGVSPAGSAARASLLTGRIPSYHGVHDNITNGNISKANGGGDFGQTRSTEYLKGIKGYPDILAKNGYVCGRCGQWNLGKALKPQMSHSYWYVNAAECNSPYRTPMIRDKKAYIETSHSNEAITTQALNFLKSNRNNQYYLNVHYCTPKGSFEGRLHPAKYYKLYDGCRFETCPMDFTHPWQVDSFSCAAKSKRREAAINYYAAISSMDHSLGLLLDYLDKTNQRQNTLIFFTSDNGMNLGHHGIWGNGNGTLPLNMYDTTLKVPTIVSMPERVPMGRLDRALLSHYDWRPTLLDMLQIEDPEAEDLPGENFKNMLCGGDISARDEIIILAEYGPVRMIRDKNWKYIKRNTEETDELYYLAMDPDEMINLVDKPHQKTRLKELGSDMHLFFKQFSTEKNNGINIQNLGGGQQRIIPKTESTSKIFENNFRWINPEGDFREDGYIPPKRLF